MFWLLIIICILLCSVVLLLCELNEQPKHTPIIEKPCYTIMFRYTDKIGLVRVRNAMNPDEALTKLSKSWGGPPYNVLLVLK